MLRESIMSRNEPQARERRSHAPSTAWWGEAHTDHPSRPVHSVWFALGLAAALGAAVFGADSNEVAATPGSSSVGLTESPFQQAIDPGLTGVDLAVTRATADPAVVTVPASSIATLDGKAIVFVAEPELHLFAATPVELGDRVGGEQRVTAGLAPGQRVVRGDPSWLAARLR